MKKIFLSLLAVSAFAACSDDEGDAFVVCPVEHLETISFEAEEQLVDFLGEPVVPERIELQGGWTAGQYDGVFWAGRAAYADYMLQTDPNEAGMFSTYFDGPLFSTADGNVWFGSYYSDNAEYGSRADSSYGFMITSNYDRSASELDYTNQFKVWAKGGVMGSKNCALCYYSAWGGTYAVPTVELVAPRRACHCYLANTAITATYRPSVVDAEAFEYKVVVTGWLDGAQTGSVECALVAGGEKVEDWTFVDLSPLGKVDRLTFRALSNDVGAYGDNAPTYFALDQIGLAAE